MSNHARTLGAVLLAASLATAAAAGAYTDPLDLALKVPRWTSRVRVEKSFLDGKPRFNTRLTWACEDPQVRMFSIRRRSASGKEVVLSTSGKHYVDRDVEPGQRYSYTLFGERISTEAVVHSRSDQSETQEVLIEEPERRPPAPGLPVQPLRGVEPEAAGAALPWAGRLDGPHDELWVVAAATEPARLGQEDWLLGGGELQATDAGGRVTPLLPLHTEVHVTIRDGVARILLGQTFRLLEGAPPAEVVFRFPLPLSAAATDFVVAAGGRRIRGLIRDRETAAQVLERLAGAGGSASLQRQAPRHGFRQRIPAPAPGGDVEVLLAYVEPLEGVNGGWNFSFPLVAGPRFTFVSQHQSSRPGRRSGRDVAVSVDLEAPGTVGRITSTTQAIEVERRSPRGATVRLKATETIPNKDFTLRFETGD